VDRRPAYYRSPAKIANSPRTNNKLAHGTDHRVYNASKNLLAHSAAAIAMMNGSEIKKAAINQAKKVATTAATVANSNGQKKRRKGDNLKPIITTDGSGTSLHESPTQAEPG